MKILIFILAISLLLSCNKNKPLKTGLEGKSLPAFALQLPDSTHYFNTKNLPVGKPVALFYYSPQCPYSHAQMEGIIKDIDKLKDIQFCIFTSLPYPYMKAFYDEYKIEQYPNITMGVDTSSFFASYFAATAVPYTAIYSKDKKLREVFVGAVAGKQIKAIAEN